MRRSRLERIIPLFSLPITLAVCLALWFVMSSNARYTEVAGTTGSWDLRGFDFESGNARITGAVEYIPNALLTPAEFEARSDEIQVGIPPEHAGSYSTSRIRILLPQGASFTVAGRSIDYSDKIYVNGKLMAEIGQPGETKETSVPNTAFVSFMDEPVNGVITMVQQTSNFVHRQGGNHADWRVGLPGVMQAASMQDVSTILIGCFLALFLVHLALYFILRSYPANLYFSLFCLTWLLRTGATGDKVFSTLLPQLSWYAKFRIEYLSLPVTGILIILMLNELFPGVLPLWYRRGLYALSAVFAVVFLFADTVFMSRAIFGCYAYQALAMLLLLFFFIRRFRRPSLAQVVSLCGVALFLYAGLRDMFYYTNILLPPIAQIDLSRVAMLFFVFCQMTAMFMGTVHAAEQAKATEQRMAAQNAALDRMSRMKSELISTISHETRTPLAVLSGYAELISMELRAKGVDEATATDLDRIADEAQRLAAIMEEMQQLSREKDADTQKSRVSMADIIGRVARLYEPILARKNTRLKVALPNDLPAVYANPDEVTQVLFNLLANARTHTQNGVVSLTARREGAMVAVQVQDTGSGIPTAFLPHAFERGSHGNPEGSGIGLAICKEIVEGHGGEIAIESTEGKGTTVRFTLPAENGTAAANSGNTASTDSNNTPKEE